MSHLTLEDRITIQSSLNEGISISIIAKLLNKHPSTISREIKKHLTIKPRTDYPQTRMMNNCLHRNSCKVKSICRPQCQFKKGQCRFCGHCHQYCSDYQKEVCPVLSKSPYVCNGCHSRHKCTLEQKYYSASKAHEAYRHSLVSLRTGFNFTEQEITLINNELAPLIRDNKQSVYHACLVKADILPCDVRTIYALIDANMLPHIKNIDLPRKCKLKPRKKGRSEHKIDKKCRVNRTYQDYQEYIRNNPDVSIVEMDTVEGTKGGKCIITFLFTRCNLQLYYLVEDHTSQKVIQVIDDLYENILGPELFQSLFQVILTDNGTEFSNPYAIEHSALNEPRCKVFYCDPAASYQKGACENNHEMLRKFIPKGSSFDNFQQDQLDIISCHINSYKRKKLNNQSPFDTFSFFFGEHILHRLNLSSVSPDKICLSLDALNR